MKKIIAVSLFLLICCACLLCACVSPTQKGFKIEFVYTNQQGADVVYKTIYSEGNEKIAVPKTSPMEDYILNGWYFTKDSHKAKDKLRDDSFADQALTQDVVVYAYLTKKEIANVSLSDEIVVKDGLSTEVAMRWAPSVLSMQEGKLSVRSENEDVFTVSVKDTQNGSATLVVVGVSEGEAQLVVTYADKSKTFPVKVEPGVVKVEFFVTSVNAARNDYDSAQKVAEVVTDKAHGFKITLPSFDISFIDASNVSDSICLETWTYPYTSADPQVKKAADGDVFTTDGKLYADWAKIDSHNATVVDPAASRSAVSSLTQVQAILIRGGAKVNGIVGEDALSNSRDTLQYLQVDVYGNRQASFDASRNPFEICTALVTAKAPTELANLMPKCLVNFIANGGESLLDGAFSGYEKLQKVLLPQTLTSIGDGCFVNCPQLVKAEFDGNVQLASVGSGCFVEAAEEMLTEAADGLVYLSVNDNAYEVLLRVAAEATNPTINSATKVIADGAFAKAQSLQSLYYDGTTSQFAAIRKDYAKWRSGMPSRVTAVHCQGGDVTLGGGE